MSKRINIIISSGTHKGDTIGARFLRWAQRCEFSHVEVLFDDCIIGARTAGVKKFPLSTMPLKKELVHIDCTDSQYELFVDFLHGELGSGYDYKAYLGFLFNKETEQDQDKWFCSELLLAALEYAGIYIFHKGCVKPWNCMPRDFHINPLIESKYH